MQEFQPTILLVDDEENCLRVIRDVFELEGIECITANSGVKALEIVDRNDIDIIISDIKMPGLSGMELLKQVKNKKPGIFVIMLTGYGSINDAIDSIKHGASHYIIKPIIMEDFLMQINEIIEHIKRGERAGFSPNAFLLKDKQLVGNSLRIKHIIQLIKTVSPSNVPIFINGENGSGKELVARMLHNSSNRKEKEFIHINCASCTDAILETELFGAKNSGTESKIEKANAGTLFLDEIGSIKLAVQNKILELLKKGYLKLNAGKKEELDIRLICTSSGDLQQLLHEGLFNKELYYLITSISIHMPSLWEIKSDIPILSQYFADEFAGNFNKKNIKFTDESLSLLMNYSWPGNMRELSNVIRTAVSICHEDEIQIFDLPSHLSQSSSKTSEPQKKDNKKSMLLDDIEQDHIMTVLDMAKGNKSVAANILGIHRDTLLRKLKKYGVD